MEPRPAPPGLPGPERRLRQRRPGRGWLRCWSRRRRQRPRRAPGEAARSGELPLPEWISTCSVPPVSRRVNSPAAASPGRPGRGAGSNGRAVYTRAMKLPFEPPLEPMLAKASDGLPTGDGWLFEPKWDGFRAMVFRDGDEIYTQSRDLKPLDRSFPELAEPFRAALPERCIVDGEIV